jgi:hypothetical protein
MNGPMCRFEKFWFAILTAANEKADLQIQSGNYRLVPKGDLQKTWVGGNLRGSDSWFI